MINKLKHIFFDFDGVLAESVHIKTQAFYDLYLPYGEDIANKAKDHHRIHGGVSRFEKFKIYHKEFLGQEIGEGKVQELAQQFSDLVVEGVSNAPEVPGAGDFLEKYRDRLDYWIITGTPTAEMEQVAQARGIAHYFKEICGSPNKKDYWTEYLIEKHSLKRDEVLFLGDAMSDYNAAKHSGLHFALRSYEENKELFADYKGLRFGDFYELESNIFFQHIGT